MDMHTQSPVEIIASLEKRLAAIAAQESRLVAENTLLKQLYEKAPLAYQSLDCNGCLIEVNQAWLETLGYTREEVIGRNFGDFLHPDWRDHFIETFPKFKAIGEILGIEFELIKKDGCPILVSFHGKIGKGPEGHFQQTHCVFQDMTRRKQEEEALRESEERFRAIHNASFGGILIHEQGIILDCNQNLSVQTGYSIEELIGMDGFLLTAPDYRDLVRQNIQRSFDQPYEIIGLRKDGTKYPISVQGTNVPYKGRLVRMTEFRDITEYKRMEEALEKRLVTLTCPLTQTNGIAFEDLFDPAAIQRLQDAFASATGVASIITHPNGTPITAPSNFTHLCSKIIRQTEQGCFNCYQSDAAIGRYHPSGPIVQQCLSGGLWDAGASITVGGRHLANWLIGQVRDETQNEESMRAYAHAIGADEAAFMKAFREVPSMSQERFGYVAQALFIVANQLSSAAYQNIQQARSITERKHAEEALRASEERFRMAMEATKDGLWDWDTSSGNIYYSPGYWMMLGYDVDTRPQSAEAWTELIHPDDKEAVFAANNDCIENRCETFFIEYRMRANGGSWKWIQSRGKAVKRGDNGHALRMVGTHVDITERKRIEKQILTMNDDLERKVELRTQELQETQKQLLQTEKLSAIGQLSASIAHEFNNPLQSIHTILKGLKKRAILEEEDRALLNAAISESDRMKNLIQSLREFNRPSSGRQVSMDLHKCIDLTLLLHRSALGKKRISVVLNYAERLPQILAVPDQIKQVILNLFSNAADACQQSGGVITISTRQESEKVAIAIKDTGVGIKPEQMGHIYRPFYTTKGEVKGTGLGLSVSYGIIKKHQGEIRVESQPGEGTTFTVLLPIKGCIDTASATDESAVQ
jgi:PAS domain S-box-containing protein